MTVRVQTRRWFAAGTIAALAASALVMVGVQPALADDPRTFALVGSLQSELGCPGDWAPDCADTELAPTDVPGVYAADFTLPAGSYEYKVAVDDSWDEAYGLNGGGDNIPLTIAGETGIRFTFDDTTHRVGLAPLELDGAYSDADADLIADPVRQPGADNVFYFVMTDRFENGDASNDTGGLTGDSLATGYDPTAKGFYNGGDIAGLRSRLDYIDQLGTTAIWLTPSFKNKPVQGTGANASAGYHGYWITDFTQIDPHLGTNAELEALIDEAHAKDIKVYFDIITNHTADVIAYEGGQTSYIDQATSPYKDADGVAFNPADYAGTEDFPTLDPATSFPYVPTIDPAEADVKVPAWLNDPTIYHNRGDSTWEGESVTFGDFSGLDDLMTEDPKVVDGFVDVYNDWVDLGIDGFRIDTAKHVNFEFWQKWSTAVKAHAASIGNDDFFMFGEVYDADPTKLSPYVRNSDMNSVLDFTFQSQAVGYASGNSAKSLQSLFAGDDYYTTPHSSATALPTFLGNHDMGRVGYFLQNTDDSVQRDSLAHDLMFLTRGQPVVYYGDEQGFAGAGQGNDQSARQTLFPSQVTEYTGQNLITGEPVGTGEHFATDGELYTHIAELSALRQAHPALSSGAQIERYVDNGPGVYAFSRVDASEKTEYLVAVNNSAAEKTVSVPTLTKSAAFAPLYGTTGALASDADGLASVTVPALGAVVWKAGSPVSAPTAPEAITLAAPTAGAGLSGVSAVSADVADDTWQQTSFAWRTVGDTAWTELGTAETTAPRVFHDVKGLAAGTLVEYRAVTTDAAGNHAAASTYASVGNAVTTVVTEEPEEEISLVTIPGSHNSEMGCAGDWTPACETAKLTKRADGIYAGTFDIPEGDYEFKVALNGSWDVNYGANGVKDGANIAYTAPGGPITFYFDPRTHQVQNTAQGPMVTAPGSYQSEVGCPGDWQPECLATWLTDGDGDGVYEWSSDKIPSGSYELKVTHGLSWDENYGVGGAPGGGNLAFTATEGKLVTLRYTIATHVLEVVLADPPLAGTGELRAHWVSENTLAWPQSLLGDADAADATFALHHSADAALAVTDGAVTGDDGAVELEYDSAGLSDAEKAAFPALASYEALHPVGLSRSDVAGLVTEQLLVSQQTDDTLSALTGVQLPGVLDDLYAADLGSSTLGVSWSGSTPTLRLWAPTAQSAELLVYPTGVAGDPVSVPAEWNDADGTWAVSDASVTAGTEYRWSVDVYAPTTGSIESNSVTDPYSVALTTNSERSVVVDLADNEWAPEQWANTEAPVIDKPVDRAIYELHVRDFSIGDTTVPEAERGTYRAFTRESAGTDQLRQLADAGINTVHLLPTFDLATIEEDRAAQQQPACDLASFGPASAEQQACVAAVADTDGYNWGYDPYHFQAPEGSYAVDPNGGARVEEFREMVGALHATGLQVVLDEVYNHTAESGQGQRSVLDRVVPGYYQRLNAVGNVETSTCCQNVATEHAAAEKLMVDSVVLWAKEYKVDGFRFDLMGHHSKANMLAVRAALDELTLADDGVDGQAVYLYGEGWNFGEVADNALFEQATQGQLGGTGIGTFNDRLRDAVHGGSPVDASTTYAQGYGTGLSTDSNGNVINGTPEEAAAALARQTDLVKLGLAGNLRGFEFETADGSVKRGDALDYNGQPAGYSDEPAETINYLDAHDNETLYDLGVLKLPTDTPMADRIRMNTLSLATATLSQAPSFWHAGTELLRSKSLDRNSFNSGDWFNRIDWTGQTSTFGSGLPPAADNEDKWPLMAPLLADPALKPAAADIAAAEAQALDLLRLRSDVDLLRLGSAELIDQKVSFPGSGPAAVPGVIAMSIDDLVGPDADPDLDGALVVFNASPDAATQALPSLKGRDYALSSVQASGADAVVTQTTWNKAAGSVTIPGRSVAVLLDDQAPAPVKTTVLAAPNKLLAKAGSAVKVVGKVIAADRSTPVGTITVTDNGKVIATETLTAGDKGRIDVKLPKLAKGLHLIRTTFAGVAPYESSRSIPLPVLLW
nr:pullulanase-type alpha-1,6-glucosidase [Leifsonia sp. Leaf325]